MGAMSRTPGARGIPCRRSGIVVPRQPGEDLSARHGAREAKTLVDVDAESPDERTGELVLDALGDDRSPRSWASPIVALTMVASAASFSSRKTNDWSILTSLTGSRSR